MPDRPDRAERIVAWAVAIVGVSAMVLSFFVRVPQTVGIAFFFGCVVLVTAVEMWKIRRRKRNR